MTQLTRCLEAVSPDSDCNFLCCNNCMNIVSKVQEKDDSQEDDSQERKRACVGSSRSSRRSTKGHNYKFLDSSALSQTKSSKSKPKCSHCKNGSDCAVKYTREQAIRELLVNGASHLKMIHCQIWGVQGITDQVLKMTTRPVNVSCVCRTKGVATSADLGGPVLWCVSVDWVIVCTRRYPSDYVWHSLFV